MKLTLTDNLMSVTTDASQAGGGGGLGGNPTQKLPKNNSNLLF